MMENKDKVSVLCVLLSMVFCYIPSVPAKGLWLKKYSQEHKVNNMEPRGQVVS